MSHVTARVIARGAVSGGSLRLNVKRDSHHDQLVNLATVSDFTSCTLVPFRGKGETRAKSETETTNEATKRTVRARAIEIRLLEFRNIFRCNLI